jgi:hypothetical protein
MFAYHAWGTRPSTLDDRFKKAITAKDNADEKKEENEMDDAEKIINTFIDDYVDDDDDYADGENSIA